MIDFTQVTDRNLLEMCKRGDDDAWRYLYAFVLAICSWSRYRGSLHAEPEDLAQEIVLHLLDKAMAELKSGDSFRAFVKRVTVNRIEWPGYRRLFKS
jgi:DNA-directed RNA polymerase specialized sigma24 family protein